MSVLARAADGSWHTVMQLGSPDAATVGQVLLDDVGLTFELDAPAPVAAVMPAVPGAPDAIALTPAGEVVVVLSIGCESIDDVRQRCVELLDWAEDCSLVELTAACNQIGLQHTPGSWLVETLGRGDAIELDRAIGDQLDAGALRVVLAARAGIDAAAPVVVELRQSRSARFSCHELVLLGAGSTRMLECYPVPEGELAVAARSAERRANADLMLEASAATLGLGARPLVDTLLHYCEAFFAGVSFRSVGSLVVLDAWLDDEHAVLELDSSGSLVVHVHAMDPIDRRYFVRAVEGMVDADLGLSDTSELRTVSLSLIEHLGDVSLVEQLLGALSDGFLATMCNELSSRRAA